MREILFRGKCTDDGEWVYGYLGFIYVDGKNENGFIYKNKARIYSQERCIGLNVLTETVGQYTGLTDKNGNKIFEGDIVECVSYREFFSNGTGTPLSIFRRKMVVVLHEGAFQMEEKLPEPLKNNYWALICDGDIEILGNIHDDPDLLKADQMLKLEPDFIVSLCDLFVRPEFKVISLTYLFSQDEIMITYSDEHFDKISVVGIEGRTLEIIYQIAEAIKNKNALPAVTGQDAR